MFVISVIHLGLVIQQFAAVVIPVANFQTQIVLSALQFVIGDMVLIWRVWVIWGKNYYVAAGPLIIMIIAACFTFNEATLTETRIFFTTAPTAMIVANTTICTLLISGRIWYMHRELVKASGTISGTWHSTGGGYKGAMILIIESGSLYALTQLCSLILDHVHSPGLSIMLNLEIPLIGILPTLIVVLVHFHMVPGNNSNKRPNGTNQAPRQWGRSAESETIETIRFTTNNKIQLTTVSETTSGFGMDKSTLNNQSLSDQSLQRQSIPNGDQAV
ncbi:hypothetical protein C0993_006410 [Termitomyces sp. T159_Od127]|nr:hypothetical protein C0993_006410 [Termitomyces sp. T159_Od127]